MSSTDLKRLRAKIEAQRSAAGRVPAGVRTEVAAAVRRAHETGASYSAIASALGLKLPTLLRWRDAHGASKLVAVRVPVSASASAFAVHGPRGVRIEGLSLDDVAALLSRLS